ncbi:MAG: ABC transporter ATP-binding protein/permease [Actinomycetota bacterium]|nr:ABC transporter ATP-binding protein/permease [Actinomycetota bacterium]
MTKRPRSGTREWAAAALAGAVLLLSAAFAATATGASAQQLECPTTGIPTVDGVCKDVADAVSPSDDSKTKPDSKPNRKKRTDRSGSGGGSSSGATTGTTTGGSSATAPSGPSAPSGPPVPSSSDQPATTGDQENTPADDPPKSPWTIRDLFQNEYTGPVFGMPAPIVDAAIRTPFASAVIGLLRLPVLLPTAMLVLVAFRYRKARKERPRVPLRKVWRLFRPALAGQGFAIARAAGLTLVVVGLELLQPWPIKFVVDRVLRPDAASGIGGFDLSASVIFAAAATLVISVLLGVLSVRAVVAAARVGRKVTVRIRRQVFEHLHRLALPFHESARTGDLLGRLMDDVNNLRDVLFNTWINLIGRALLFLGTAIALLVIEPWLAFIALLPLPLLAVEMMGLTRTLQRVIGHQFRREGSAASIAGETLTNIGVVKAFVAEDRSAEQFTSESRRGERAGVRAAAVSARMDLVSEVLTGAGLAAVLFFGALRVLSGDLSPGMLFVLVAYTRSMYKPLRKAPKEGKRLSKAMASAGRLLEVLRVRPEKFGIGRVAPEFSGHIALRNVSFAYQDGVEALRGVSLEIPAGALAVVKGPNGSGKSTLLSLILRLFKPDEGRVLIDGQLVDSFELESYRSRFAYVPQQVQLFAATVRDNIAYGRPDASDGEIEEAARIALLDDVVRRLPGGYEAMLGENGATVSGGEARRLMLARAALRDARVILLDEPLAGLDPEAREVVAEAIQRLSSDRTVLVVSHGPASELDPDVAVDLRDGEIERLEWADTAGRKTGRTTDTIGATAS